MIVSHLLEKVPGIQHAFGTRKEPSPPVCHISWEANHPSWKQVHSTAFARVTNASQNCGEVDALLCSPPTLPISGISADCLPILMAKKDDGMVAAVHAGWRGTKAH